MIERDTSDRPHARPAWFARVEKLVTNIEQGVASGDWTDDVIRHFGHLVHKLKAKDTTGRWAYYFVLVTADREADFLNAIEGDGNVDLELYGKVIASCYGEEPDQNTKALLHEKYGFIV